MTDIANHVYSNMADTPAVTLAIGEALNVSANAKIYAAGTGTSSHGILAGRGQRDSALR